MEDTEAAPGSPHLQYGDEPQGNNDNQDPLTPGHDEENNERTPPTGDPTADTQTYDDDEAPETVDAMDEAADEADGGSDSELEELDEKEFEDFNPDEVNIPDKPVQVDADNVGLLGVHKRKRTEEEERERKRKKREGKRDKPKRSKKNRDTGDDFEGGPEIEGKRSRKSKGDAEARPRVRKAPTPEDEDSLTPEERRRRALDRKMDEALKSGRKGRRRAGVHLEQMADAEIETMRHRMAKACEMDAEARQRGEVATHKLKILPEVVELMNRNTIQAQLVDPDINILEAVRFMLEPADQDAALPNYQIQRELFAILGKLNIGKDALIASGIGKVVLFYTKSIQPQADIKRQAERLIGEWMRVVLKKDKTLRNRPIEKRAYDPDAPRAAQDPASQAKALAAERRRKAMALPHQGRGMRIEGGLQTYSVAPTNAISARAAENRRTGADDQFKEIVKNSQNRGGRR